MIKSLRKISIPVLLSLIVVMIGLLSTAAAAGGEELIVELDRTEVYPGQDVLITISYRASFPDTEEYDFHADPINMVVTTSGLVEDIETTDYLLVPLIGSPIKSGVKYPAAKVEFTVPEKAGEHGLKEEIYQVYIKNLEGYSNKVSLKVLPIPTSSQPTPGPIALFSRGDVIAGIIILSGAAIGGSGYAVMKMKKKPKGPILSKGNKQLLLSNPIEGKGWRIVEINENRSIIEGSARTLSDEEVNQIKRVTRTIDGSEYDDLEWVDPQTGEKITWRGPDIIEPTTPKTTTKPATTATKPTQAKTTQAKTTPTQAKTVVKPKTGVAPVVPPITPVPKTLPQTQTQTTTTPSAQPKEWGNKLTEGVEQFNKTVSSDKRLQKALDHYKGKRIVLDVEGEGAYGFDVKKDGLTLKRNVDRYNEEDLYIKMSSKQMKRIFDEINKYREYQKYVKKPENYPKKVEKTTKLDVLMTVGVIVTLKVAESVDKITGPFGIPVKIREPIPIQNKTIRGIDRKDINFLKNLISTPTK